MSTIEYEAIVHHCVKTGELWEDPEFPAVQSSVFYHQTPPFSFQWKRPHEISSNPTFVSDNFTINSGKLGDRWFSSCLGCLRTTEGLLYRVVPADQGFDDRHDYVGIFRFRIWWCGEWKEVIVDDRLPTVNNKLVFTHALFENGDRGPSGLSIPGPFWPALLEKAYSKLHGSYEALKYGTTLDGLSDLTGGIAENVPLKSESTGSRELLSSLLRMTTVVLVKVLKDTNETSPNKSINEKNKRQHNDNKTASERLANGIVTEESYRVYGMQRIETLRGEKLYLVRLRKTMDNKNGYQRNGNTGGYLPYIGDWSSESAIWQTVDSSTRDRFSMMLQSECEFWMSYNDFLRTYTHIEAVHLDADTARDEPSLIGKMPWVLRLYHGRWQKGVTAGGCRNNTETFHMNPRLCLSLQESGDIVMALNQHTAMDPKVIGFTGYPLSPSATTSSSSSPSLTNGGGTSSSSAPNGDTSSGPNSSEGLSMLSLATSIGRSYFRSKKSLLNSQYTNSKQVSLRSRLDGPSQVLILPTTFEPGDESAFTFRVFSRSSGLRMKIVDVVPAVIGNVFARAVAHEWQVSNSSHQNGNGHMISQNGNSTAVSNSVSSSKVAKDFSQYEPIFLQMSEDKKTVNAFELADLLEACLPNDYIKSCASIEVCRQIVIAFDSTNMGRITFENFKDLMCSLKIWHNVFKNWTKELKSGILKADRLRDALSEVGLQVNSTILGAVMHRYIRKDGTLRFGDFVAILLNLSIAFDAFDKRDVMQNGSVRIGRTEWLKLALMC